MRKREITSTLGALDNLSIPGKDAALCRAKAYAKAGITALDPPAYPLPKPHPFPFRRPAMAAALALTLLGVGVGTALGADLYTYGKASDFFTEYGLSIQGLERGDLWDVYRDITTGQFSLPATGQMLQSNMGIPPSGSLSSDEMESMWEGWKENYTSSGWIPLDTAYFIHVLHHDRINGHSQKKTIPLNAAFFTPNPAEKEIVADPVMDSDSLVGFPLIPAESYGYGRDDQDGLIFHKKRGDELLWLVSIGDIAHYIQYQATDDYVAVTGYTDRESPDIRFYLLSSDGRILWSHTLDNGESQELPQYILFEENTVTLFSWTDRVHICRSVFDLSGNLLENSVSTLEEGAVYSVKQVIPFRDGYLLLMNNTGIDTPLFYMNAEGEITDRYGFEDGGWVVSGQTGRVFDTAAYDLEVDRILEAHGYLYVSLTGVSAENNQELNEWTRPYWQELQENETGVGIIGGQDSVSDFGDEFAARVRACYRSFLLVCDPETMDVLSVTIMDGAYVSDYLWNASSSLFCPSTQRNYLVWTVEAPYATVYSPYTSSFTYAGASYRYTYTLFVGENGATVVGEPQITYGNPYRH